jgi:hypothetical protein
MRVLRVMAWTASSTLVSIAACSSFTGAETGTMLDGGAEAAETSAPPIDASAPPIDAPAGPSTFCGAHPTALFCDDFEGNDLAERWPITSLQLGLADVIDGAGVNRAGTKVLRFVRTKGGANNEVGLYLRHQLGGVVPVRVAYDMRTNDWPSAAGVSAFTCGNSVHGGLYSWLSVGGESKSLSYLAYTGDSTFGDRLGGTAGLSAPVNRWEHYEVVMSPGPPTHYEFYVGVPPAKIGENTFASIPVPNDAGFSPTYVEIGFTRSNVGPMPELEGYYDNVLVTSP